MWGIACTNVIYMVLKIILVEKADSTSSGVASRGPFGSVKGKDDNLKDGGSEGGKKWIKLRYL